MKIIPAVNCPDFKCVEEKIKKAAEFSDWVQIDIADGNFTDHKTWNNPAEISNIKSQIPNLNLEVHLMVESPEKEIEKWFKNGADRIIIHLEAIQNLEHLKEIKNRFKNKEIGLAIETETSIEKLLPYCPDFNFFQILAVGPGKSGQEFQKDILEKIKFLRQNCPSAIIEVDGGINLETAKLCKEAGADILVAGAYIWGSVNYKKAYDNLLTAVN